MRASSLSYSTKPTTLAGVTTITGQDRPGQEQRDLVEKAEVWLIQIAAVRCFQLIAAMSSMGRSLRRQDWASRCCCYGSQSSSRQLGGALCRTTGGGIGATSAVVPVRQRCDSI